MDEQSFKLEKHNRVASNADFRKAFKQQIYKVYSQQFTLLVAPNSNDAVRLGVVVSKKTSKKAVIRNAIKRQVREHFRVALPNIIKLITANSDTGDLQDKEEIKLKSFDLIIIAQTKNSFVDKSSKKSDINKNYCNDSLDQIFNKLVQFLHQKNSVSAN